MFIDVSGIRKSPVNEFHFNLQGEFPDIGSGDKEVRAQNPVEISLDIKKSGRILVFSGKIRGQTELVCSRCLERYIYQVDTGFSEMFCHVSDRAEVAEEGLNTDDIHFFESNRIELNELIREIILLGIPMKLVCRANCQGICAGCGTDLNKETCDCKSEDIDPRLEGLKKFFDRNNH